jgi:hypothetical protein
VFAGIGIALVAVSFVVGRARVGSGEDAPYVGPRGGERGKEAGLAIFFRRAGEERPLQPGTPLAAGDVLRFAVRGERPRYLVVRLRDAGGAAATVFPSGGTAARVAPGDTLPVAPVIGPGGGKVVVTALFSDRMFPVEAPPGPDDEVVNVVVPKAAP